MRPLQPPQLTARSRRSARSGSRSTSRPEPKLHRNSGAAQARLAIGEHDRMTHHRSDQEPDVAIVGGGLMGACVAWGLARQGVRVCVLDEGDIALRASRANFALIWVQGKGIDFPAYAAWTKAAAEAWPRLAAELGSETGINVGLDQPG